MLYLLHLIVENILLVGVALHTARSTDIGDRTHITIRWILRNEQRALRPNPRHLTAFVRGRVVFLDDFEDLVTALFVGYRVHGFNLATTTCMLAMPVETALGRVII